MQILLLLSTFVCCLAVDVAASKWVLAVNERRRGAAALYSGLCTLLNLASLWLCLENYVAVLPAVAGHALGTFLAIPKEEAEEDPEEAEEVEVDDA